MQPVRKHCECGWLGSCLNDPMAPVGYDAQSNSFHFVGPNDSRLILYYCPMCGDKFPESDLQIDVPIAPDGELQRLQDLTKDISDPDSTIKKLGEPDYDGSMKTYWESSGEYSADESSTPIRNIEYYSLSDWYTVELYFCDEKPEVRITPKLLNARQLSTKFDRPELPNMPVVGDLDSELLE